MMSFNCKFCFYRSVVEKKIAFAEFEKRNRKYPGNVSVNKSVALKKHFYF